MTARWVPGDDELDAVARTLDADAPGADRVESIRTAILASAATRKQKARYSAVPFIAAGIAIAAAATVVLVIGTRSGEKSSPVAAAPRQLITPIGIARFERVADWPDYLVRVDDGKLAVQVGKLAANERFRIKTADAEVEVRGTKFDVGIETGRLTSVAVHEGRVEVRRTDQQVVILSAGESWAPVQTAQRDEVELPARPPTMPPTGDLATTADHAATVDHAITAAHAATTDHTTTATRAAPVDHASTANHTTTPAHAVSANHAATSATTAHANTADHASTADHPTTTVPADASRPATQPNRASNDPANHPENPPPAGSRAPQDTTGDTRSADAHVLPPPTAPGEAEFRAGWAALRAGDPAAAATAFTTACKTVHSDAIGEDACFWAGAAAKRAGDTATARAALSQFVQRFPTSSRAAEASALLGWLLYDAGELDAAEKLFQKAEHDPVPKVRDSATRGLTAIDRKRHGTR